MSEEQAAAQPPPKLSIRAPLAAHARRLKALTALTLFLLLATYLARRGFGWRSDVFSDIATVLAAIAGLLWIAHDLSEKTGTACDEFFTRLDARAVSLLKAVALVFSLVLWVVAANGLYVALIRYAASRGMMVAMVFSVLSRLLFFGTMLGLLFYMWTRFQKEPKEPLLPPPFDKLLTAAGVLTLILNEAATRGRTAPPPSVPSEDARDPASQAMIFMVLVLVLGANIILFFPATFLALAVNGLLVYVGRTGWWILAAPVSAGEAVREFGEGRSVTLGVVFVLSVIAVAMLALALALKYIYE